MFGLVGFEDFQVRCIIGVTPSERILEQSLFIDLCVELDFAKAAAQDSIQETVDYVALSRLCEELAKHRQYFLLETFAKEVVETILNAYPVAYVKIKVKKPSAIGYTKATFVELALGERQGVL